MGAVGGGAVVGRETAVASGSVDRVLVVIKVLVAW